MLPPSEDSPAALACSGAEPEYNPEERRSLLQLAHQAIVSRIERRELPEGSFSEHLSQPRGVFTTLYSHHKLRGCVGYPLAAVGLYHAVIDTARQAAFEDPRFLPLTQEELPGLTVSLSVLSPLAPIAVDQIEVGRHGLLISQGTRRGLLLPQVPVEHGWNRIAFLEQTCKKAGLPLDAWRHEAKLEGFTAEVFGDGAYGETEIQK